MKKRKEKILSGVVYTSTFLSYSLDGKITGISNDEPTTENYLEISNDLINDFKLGKKNFYIYDITYFEKLKEGILQQDESIITYTSFLNIVPAVDHFKNEITLLHNKNNWELKIRDDVKHDNFKLVFYLIKKDDPGYFYSQLVFDLNNLKLEFKNKFEYDLKKFSVAVMKKFNSYGVKENYEI